MHVRWDRLPRPSGLCMAPRYAPAIENPPALNFEAMAQAPTCMVADCQCHITRSEKDLFEDGRCVDPDCKHTIGQHPAGVPPLSQGSDPPSKRVKLESHDLIYQHPLTTVNTWVNIHQKKLAGFAVDQCRVFVRSESVALWAAMESAVADGHNLRVSGPPGTGKSTEAWAWARWKAHDARTKVVWFHFSKNRATKVTIDGSLDSKQVASGYSAKIDDIEESGGHVLIVDGVTKKDSVDINRACSVWRDQSESRVFVTISSVSVPVAVQEDEEAHIVKQVIPSWTLEQYRDACQDDAFFNLVKANLATTEEVKDDKGDLLLAKYAYAGGSARWMFEFTMDKFHEDFRLHFEKVDNFKEVYSQGGGDQKADAVNHLRGLTITPTGEHKYFFISQYATRRLSAKCDDARQFIIDGYQKASETGNPAFRGWIFEFDIDYQLTQAQKQGGAIFVTIRSYEDGEGAQESVQKEEWLVNEYITFSSREELPAKLKSLSANTYLWAKPDLWCQKAFDFLRFHRQGDTTHMIAVNASHAKKHAVLLSVLHDLGKYLAEQECAVGSIVFRFVVPSGEKFEVGNVAGRLDDWGWPGTKQQMFQNHRIAVADIVCTSM